ncbi:MAG TPA: 2-C-methyl-D-erythritol 2,4-cyclodiphosphate synthase [Thermoanaerobaculia bacterium]|jgi:2-C-methyl-D-erythritol 2,4-cyclodiphosphate synthase|nr:2-C-methyl-D-erythritol 2,4-cyclodiphosphate synthase [Thermoanaerobaculia bacterium]
MIRIGQGIDVHPFDDSRPLILGGVRISDSGGLSGHSDADVVLHAVTDALLGAAGAGDIGQYFPSDDPKWKGVDSSRFVREARTIITEMNGEITNIDITIIAEKPRIAPHREAIGAAIAKLLDLPRGHVNVKATSTDHLGFIGRGEGVCAMAIVAIEVGGGSEHSPIEGVL